MQDALERRPVALDTDSEDADPDDDEPAASNAGGITAGTMRSLRGSASTSSRPTPGSSRKDSDFSPEAQTEKGGETDCEIMVDAQEAQPRQTRGAEEGQALSGYELDKILAQKQENGRLQYLCKFKGPHRQLFGQCVRVCMW